MFSSRFWSPGYHDGLETLFAKLNQGISENSELLAMAQARADAEDAHGQKLRHMASTLAPSKHGFGRDDGATMRKAYEGIVAQMDDEGKHHIHIADSIRSMVIIPFTKWSGLHKGRIETSRSELRKLVKIYQQELDAAHRAQQRYFNRCRLEEDQEPNEEADNSQDLDERGRNVSVSSSANGGAGGSGGSGAGAGVGAAATTPSVASRARSNSSTSSLRTTTVRTASDKLATLDLDNPSSEELVFGDRLYTADESQILVARMLQEIPRQATKVAILGTYEDTSSGVQIAEWVRTNTAAESIEQVEKAGQNLVDCGILRLIGQVGSRFVNSSVFMYQWRPRAWEFAGLSSAASTNSEAVNGAQNLYKDLAARWTARTDPSTQSVRELDQKYRKSVAILDNARTDLEATMFEHFNYLERCERERLIAFKAVLLDFAAAVSNIVPAMSASVDKMLLYHETADVDRDLRFLVENYQTGSYNPNVIVYDNYYSSVDGAAVFGLDLDLRARADKKRVPVIVSAALSAMDSAYPPMENDEARLFVWQTPIYNVLRQAQEARQVINNNASSAKQIREHLGTLPPVVVVQTLKLYLLELPNSVISGQLYDILKGIYVKFGGDSEEQVQARIQSLQNTLAQFTLSHIATLDALTAHIHRLVTIANASQDSIDQIAKEWGPVLCRPKLPSALSLDDVFPVQMFKDLLDSRDRIFGELKRYAMLSPQASTSSASSRSRLRSLSARVRAPSGKQQQQPLHQSSPETSSRSASPVSQSTPQPQLSQSQSHPAEYIPSSLSQEHLPFTEPEPVNTEEVPPHPEDLQQ